MKTIECPECCGVGTVIEQFEPVPGGNMPGDDKMGESIRCAVKCKVCKGKKVIPVPEDYETCGTCGFDHYYEPEESAKVIHPIDKRLNYSNTDELDQVILEHFGLNDPID